MRKIKYDEYTRSQPERYWHGWGDCRSQCLENEGTVQCSTLGSFWATKWKFAKLEWSVLYRKLSTVNILSATVQFFKISKNFSHTCTHPTIKNTPKKEYLSISLRKTIGTFTYLDSVLESVLGPQGGSRCEEHVYKVLLQQRIGNCWLTEKFERTKLKNMAELISRDFFFFPK